MPAMKWCWTTPQLVLRALISWKWKMPFSILFSTDHSLVKTTVFVMKILVHRELRSHLISTEPFPYDFSLPFLCFLPSLRFVFLKPKPPSFCPSLQVSGQRLRSRIAEQLLYNIEPDHHETLTHLEKQKKKQQQLSQPPPPQSATPDPQPSVIDPECAEQINSNGAWGT